MIQLGHFNCVKLSESKKRMALKFILDLLIFVVHAPEADLSLSSTFYWGIYPKEWKYKPPKTELLRYYIHQEREDKMESNQEFSKKCDMHRG